MEGGVSSGCNTGFAWHGPRPAAPLLEDELALPSLRGGARPPIADSQIVPTPSQAGDMSVNVLLAARLPLACPGAGFAAQFGQHRNFFDLVDEALGRHWGAACCLAHPPFI